ncbi:MAG: hypothetical protein RBT63_10405, partial [Bdellovibrionales bacterium]|nr:hypothetical protein [Bdellovibrionales bacterium]
MPHTNFRTSGRNLPPFVGTAPKQIFKRRSSAFTASFIVSVLGLSLFSPSDLFAQSADRVQQSASYRSAIDESLTIQKITVLPGSDNTDGIYARPLEAHLIALTKTSHRWESVESGLQSLPKPPLDLENNATLARQLLFSNGADAAILPVVNRGPGGLTIRLNLFMKFDGRLLAQEIVRDHKRFELSDVKAVVSEMYTRLIATIPYEGLILSRQGTRVTVNLGKSDGIRPEQSVSAVQIITENRHPKFGFLISTEKEIIGQIKILKVDDTLSFGVITTEKER